MKIGLDLDNTLINYNNLMNRVAWDEGFLQPPMASKKNLRRNLSQKYGKEQGELHWQWIQAQMYGPRLHEACLFPGVFDAIQALRQYGFEMVIVSHKTRHSNAHPNISFWEPMLAFLRNAGFFDPPSQGLDFKEKDIYFEETRAKKCERITSLDLDIFVDDLEEVFGDPQFPAHITKVLFGASPNFLSLSAWEDFSFLCRSLKLLPSSLRKWIRLAAGGNHPTFEAWGPKDRFLVKFLHLEKGDQRPRFEAETEFVKLANLNKWPVPKLIATEKPIVITEFIANKSEKADLKSCQAFLVSLGNVQYEDAPFLPHAADARFDSIGFQHALLKRLKRLEASDVPQKLGVAIRKQSEKIVSHFTWQDLEQNLWFLSPSDFGPHNSIVNQAGETFFIDFEYAGWDDPAKLMADFYWHPGFLWTKEQRWQLMEGFLTHRMDEDNQFARRLFEVLPWIGLEWICIVLNVYLPPFQERKMKRDPQCNLSSLVEQRTNRAEDRLVHFDPDCKWIQNRIGAFL